MMQRQSSPSNFCLANARNLNVSLEVDGRDISLVKSEQCYHLTSTDAEAVAATSQEETYTIVILHSILICEKTQTQTIFNLVFDPMTLTCCFCFSRMLKILVIIQSFCLILAQSMHTKKVQYDIRYETKEALLR